MAQQVVMTAEMKCSFGTAPSSLIVLPVNRTMAENQIAANILDHIPMVNILPFGMCQSEANPEVAAATAAAAGVLTPMPCIPVTPSNWTPGAPTVKIGQALALDHTSVCNCDWGGVIQFTKSGTTKTQIP